LTRHLNPEIGKADLELVERSPRSSKRNALTRLKSIINSKPKQLKRLMKLKKKPLENRFSFIH
jgi:hypothetical protein